MKKTILLFLSALIANLLPAQVWTPVLPYVTRNTLTCVQFPTERVGYIIGSGATLLKSTDGGNSWTVLDSPGSYGLTSIYFTDADNGYLLNNYSRVFYTQNGGISWEERSNGIPWELNPSTIWFQNKSTGYIGGENSIYKTTDGGKNWKQVLLSTYPEWMYFKAIGFQNATTGYAVGSYYDYKAEITRGVIVKTTDGGNTWKEQSYGNKDVDFSTVCFVNDQVGYIGGGWYVIPTEINTCSLVLKTTDGGKTWKEYTFAPSGGELGGFDFLDENTGYVCTGSLVYKTIDGGITWEEMEKEAGKWLPLYSAAMTGYDKGIAIGSDGTICKLIPFLPGVEGASIEEFLPYPNPARDYICIPMKRNKTDVVLYNAQGSEVGRYAIRTDESSVRIDVSRYPAGTYFYRCGEKNGKFTVE
ncbi:MAG: YCF48-related protein [Bacteroidales bacterium]|nr:YCF48-related protein [Bacteroidales bacterium]